MRCACTTSDTTYKPQLVYFMGIDRAKFRKPVLPGDQLHYHVKKVRSRGRAWRFYGEAKVERSDGGRGGGQRHADPDPGIADAKHG